MRLPKYSNPHLTFDATQVVSRKTLQLQDGADDDVERGGEEVEDLQVKLEEILSKRLKLKRVLTPSDGPRPIKRRKMLVEEERNSVEPHHHSEPVGEFISSPSTQASHQISPKPSVWYRNHYRLVPSISPPNLQKLYRKFHFATSSPFSKQLTRVFVFSVKEPPCEDTEQKFEERVHRSALSAVDLEQIERTFSMVCMLYVLANQIPIPTHIFVSLGERREATATA